MLPVRAVFEKRRRAKYISHLDLMRCMQRAFRRAGVPIWFTEGFNPHAYLMFPLALSLGYESGCEIMDFRLDGDMTMEEAMARLNRVLPSDLQILSVAEPAAKHTDITAAEYNILIPCADETVSADALFAAWDAFYAQPQIMIEKKTKRGVSEIDLKPNSEVLSAERTDAGVRLRLKMPAGTSVNVNPSLLIDAFTAYLAANQPELKTGMLRAERTAILCADGSAFR